MSRVVAGTLLLPNGQPMANASIYFTAKRTEPVSIIEGSNTFFNTSNAGVYNATVVNGFYAVSIEYIADASGAHTRRWPLGDVFIETGAQSTLEALLIASNPPSDLPLTLFYEILADAQQAAADAQVAAASASASAASIEVGTGPTNIPNNNILNVRLGTTENLGTAAQHNVGAFATAVQGSKADSAIQTAGLNARLGTSGNLGTLAQQNANAVNVTGGVISGVTSLSANGVIGGTSGIYASGAEGFLSSVFIPNVRNPIWRFGNALGFGLSYFQGSSGYLGSDSIGIHFGDATSAGSKLLVTQDGLVLAGGVVRAGAGFSFPAFLKATVPSAAANQNVGLIIADAVSGRRPFWSDGTNWRDAANVILS